VKALLADLKPRRYVQAFWEGGAAAFGRLDEWSDLDLYILVSDGKVEETFGVVEESLRRLSPISQTYVVRVGFEGVAQKFYRLKRASEFAVVDLAILTASSPEKFLTSEVHGKNIFYFKRGVVKVPRLDLHAMQKKIEVRRDLLSGRLAMFGNYVEKEIHRGNSLEALENYRTIVFGTLVEALRMRYNPVHYDFRLRYIHRELPPSVLQKLESLAYVKDVPDLAKKNQEARSWCEEILADLVRAPAKGGSSRR
jgi:predicted nucleotidyltransferase